MQKGGTKLSDIWEHEWVESILTATNGIIIIVVGLFLLYLVQFRFPPTLLIVGRASCGAAIVAGVIILILAGHRANAARVLPQFRFKCPYCDTDNLFTAMPTEDFDCDQCHRTVHFTDGTVVGVRAVVCPFCKTEHRVGMNVDRYVCDRCNRLLRISANPTRRHVVGTASVDTHDAMLQNYDVLLVAVDRRRENEVAFKLQNLLVVNLPEARRLMSTVNPRTPLIVGHNLAQRKAEAVRRQLQELGATASLRSTASGAQKAEKA